MQQPDTNNLEGNVFIMISTLVYSGDAYFFFSSVIHGDVKGVWYTLGEMGRDLDESGPK